MTISLANRAAIVGIGATEFSKNSGRSELRLACEATRAAILDAGLKPTDIAGFYDVGVELTTTDARALRMQEARFWADMSNLVPFLSFATAMDLGNISDTPQREMRRRAAEDVLLSPELRQMRVMQGGASLQKFRELVLAAAQLEAGGGAVAQQGGLTQAGANSAGTQGTGDLDAATLAAQQLRDTTQSQSQNEF